MSLSVPNMDTPGQAQSCPSLNTSHPLSVPNTDTPDQPQSCPSESPTRTLQTSPSLVPQGPQHGNSRPASIRSLSVPTQTEAHEQSLHPVSRLSPALTSSPCSSPTNRLRVHRTPCPLKPFCRLLLLCEPSPSSPCHPLPASGLLAAQTSPGFSRVIGSHSGSPSLAATCQGSQHGYTYPHHRFSGLLVSLSQPFGPGTAFFTAGSQDKSGVQHVIGSPVLGQQIHDFPRDRLGS